MVTKPSGEQTQDFSIHNEDFPALPGPNYQVKEPSSSSSDDNKTVSVPSPCYHGYLGSLPASCPPSRSGF